MFFLKKEKDLLLTYVLTTRHGPTVGALEGRWARMESRLERHWHQGGGGEVLGSLPRRPVEFGNDEFPKRKNVPPISFESDVNVLL